MSTRPVVAAPPSCKGVFRLAAVAVSGLILSGCASTISAYKNRAINKMDIGGSSDGTGEIVVMSGERRVAIAIPNDANFQFCAEALPDAAAAFGAATSAGLARPGVQTGLNESSAMSLLQTFNRTENAELLRTWGFLSCLAKTQGHLKDAEYRSLFKTMTDGLVDVMKANAANTKVIAGTGANVTVNPAPQPVVTQIPQRRTNNPPPSPPAPIQQPTGTPQPPG